MLGVVLVCVCAVVFTGASARNDNGNFLDDKWLTGRWDKFRDEPGSWNPGKPFDQALDPAKDPCLKIKCGRHKHCVAEDYRTPTCVSFNGVGGRSPDLLKCSRCPVVHPSPVCGTDGHTYSTRCKLEYQACISGKQISVKCPGQCPCLTQPDSSMQKKECSDAELNEVISRLRERFRDASKSGNLSKRVKFQKPEKRVDINRTRICKDPLDWVFARLDMNFDLQLDQSELSVLGSGRDGVCTKAFLRSCDSNRDQLISSQEWCSCFQKRQESPCQSEMINIHKSGKQLLGQYIPSCDENGFYRPHQCHGSSGQCWCVDRYGNEIGGSRRMGDAECAPVVESSGDFGSGDALFSDDEDDDVLNDEEELGDDEEYDDDDDDDGYLS